MNGWQDDDLLDVLDPDTRTCCDCDSEFVPFTDRQIRCVLCQVASDFA